MPYSSAAPRPAVTVEDVERALVAFEDVLDVDLPVDMPAFSRARVVLARTVNAFVADEGDDLFRSERWDVADAPPHERQALHRELVALRQRYSGHIARWTAAGLAQDWRGYRGDCVGLIVAMRKILRARRELRSRAPGRRLQAVSSASPANQPA
jgi:hypothetical protein